jgi:uncharacterized protein YrrD
MLHSVQEMHGFTVGADDGEIGAIKDLYFDDQRWAIRYMVVETGDWLSGRRVLLSPISVRNVTWADEVMHVNLSQQQVRDSPGIDADKPVSRQHEIDFYKYYGYPSYWEGANLWGLGVYPVLRLAVAPDLSFPQGQPVDGATTRERQERIDRERGSADSHLRSSEEVIGYEIMASDGPIGTVANFVFDDKNWAIRYMVVDTRKWLPGKHVLLSPEWINRVSWSEREVYVKVTRQAIETSPEYDPSSPISREHEAGLYEHHERTVYWP